MSVFQWTVSEALATPGEIEQWLKEGISAAKVGQLEQARFRLLDVVEQDQANEAAWYWLYQVFDRIDDRRICLENLILINPKNMWAKRELLTLLEQSAAGQPAVAAPPASTADAVSAAPSTSGSLVLKLVTAFWYGLSVIFLGSGFLSALEWLVLRNTPGYQIAFPFMNLTLGVIFIMAGILGLCVATALFFQAMIGFYGSILLGLGLLLVGPTFSLISDPPNYVAMTCTGGISGMIVLLTLASQSGFKDTAQNGSTVG